MRSALSKRRPLIAASFFPDPDSVSAMPQVWPKDSIASATLMKPAILAPAR